MLSNIITYEFLITGKVQRVGYRYWFVNEANLLNLTGYVKNNINHNNVVKAVIQGQIENIMILKSKCKSGPKDAIINKLTCNKIKNFKIYKNFTIKY